MARKDEHVDKIGQAIGVKVRDHRMSLGLSRAQYAELIRVTHQQLHKYENGVNRISAARLALIASSLNKPISFFYENLESDQADVPASQRICLELTRNLWKINVNQLRAINSLAKSMISQSVPNSQDPPIKRQEKKSDNLATKRVIANNS